MLAPRQLEIILHSLGLDQYGQGSMYRNRYVIGPSCDGYEECRCLYGAGMMKDHGACSWMNGMHTFSVTEEGIKAMRAQVPKPPKLSRSKQRYRAWLKVADCGMTFKEYMTRKESHS